MEYTVLIGIIYFLPWLVAASKRHHNASAIGALNVLLGWTLIGWVAAFVWAVTKKPTQQQFVVIDQNGRAVAAVVPSQPAPPPPPRRSEAREHPINVQPPKVKGLGFAMTFVGVFVALVVGLPMLAFLLS
jgi:hypothetical protein